MGDITVTAAKVAAIFTKYGKSEIYDFVAGTTITAGQAVFVLSTDGLVYLADAQPTNGTGEEQFRGIALNGGGAGQAISVLMHGPVYGFTLEGDYDDLVYLSNTAGALADAAGATTVIAGRVFPLSDADVTKVLFVDVDMADADWS